MARAMADHVGNVTLCLAAFSALVWTLFTVFGQAVDRPLSDDHTEIHGDKPGTASLTVYIPENRHDDLYQIIDVAFDGQRMPLAIETSLGDSFFASDACDTRDPRSGCYNLTSAFDVKTTTRLHEGELLDTYLGKGRVVGNFSTFELEASVIRSTNITAALINSAWPDEFQNGSFAGFIGLGLRRSSHGFMLFRRFPFVESLISQGKLARPLFSLRSPRLGDPAAKMGMLTLGQVDEEYQHLDINYGDVLPSASSPNTTSRIHVAAWSVRLEEIRINGIQVPVSPGRLRPDDQHVSAIDTGASHIYLRSPEFHAVVAGFQGITETRASRFPGAGDEAFFECAKPQSLELVINGRRLPIDPLDMLVGGSNYVTEDGVRMCAAGIRSWDVPRFADSLLGLPFLRSVFAVFDYASDEVYSVLPRVGLASMVDEQVALARYVDLYTNRLQLKGEWQFRPDFREFRPGGAAAFAVKTINTVGRASGYVSRDSGVVAPGIP